MGRLEVSDLSVDVPGRRLLEGIDFAAGAGECVSIVGPSGSGKTSLLNCLCGIATPTHGSVVLDGVDLSGLGPTKRSEIRLRRVGMVFQFGELLPELSVVENVALPLRLAGAARRESEDRSLVWLRRLGLEEQAGAHPSSLSGGEIQRAGIARAMASEPDLILADEPTGALDEANTEHVVDLLLGVARELEAAVVVTTHDPLVASKTDRLFRIHEARLTPERDSSGPQRTPS